MHLPEDVLNEIVSHMDYKSYIHYCQAQVNKTCKMTNKLEQEIKVPLIAYDSTQINKISNINNKGIYNSGHTKWDEGSVYTKPYDELILYNYYKLI